MIKNILLLFVGLIVGIPVGGGAVYLLYQQKNILPAPIDNLGILEEPNGQQIQQTTADIKSIDVYVPKSLATAGYQQDFQGIINSVNEGAKTNNDKIYPGMEQLKQMSRDGNWNGIFDVMAEVKKSVSDAGVSFSQAENYVQSFQIEVGKSPSGNDDFVAKSRAFADAAQNLVTSYQAYLDALGGFLTGKTPTQQMADDLNAKISDVSAKAKIMQQASTDVYTIIDTENGKIKASNPATSTKAR